MQLKSSLKTTFQDSSKGIVIYAWEQLFIFRDQLKHLDKLMNEQINFVYEIIFNNAFSTNKCPNDPFALVHQFSGVSHLYPPTAICKNLSVQCDD